MTAVFLKLVSMSIGAGWLVLAAVLFRLVFKKAPKALRCIVWALVALRLILPFTIESPLGLLPDPGNVPEKVIGYSAANEDAPSALPQADWDLMPEDRPASAVFDVTVPQIEIMADKTVSTAAAAQKEPITLMLLSAVWIAGAAAMALYSLISFKGLKRSIRGAESLFDNVVLCDRAPTPFIFGFLRPLIVLPSSVSEADAPFALAHEKAHIARRDHLIKPFGFALLTVYWFNPLMWLAYILLCRDIEFACDERVIRKCGARIKKSYSEALVNCSMMTRRIKACPVAFGEVGIKTRVRQVLDYKRSTAAVMAAATLACAAIGVFLLPAKAQSAEPEEVPAAEIPCEDDFNRVYLIGGACQKDSPMRIMFSFDDMRYVIVTGTGSESAVADSGALQKRDHRSVTLASDSGLDRVFSCSGDRLTLERGEEDPDDPLFGNYRQVVFRLHKARSETARYYYSNGTCYIWFPERVLYVFGRSDELTDALMNEPYFWDDPDNAAALKLALLDKTYPDCQYQVTNYGLNCRAWISSYECVYITSLSAMFSTNGIGVAVLSSNEISSCGPGSAGYNELTPGSIYARGGYKNNH